LLILLRFILVVVGCSGSGAVTSDYSCEFLSYSAQVVFFLLLILVRGAVIWAKQNTCNLQQMSTNVLCSSSWHGHDIWRGGVYMSVRISV